MDDLRALAASFDASFEGAVQGGGREMAVIDWRGHRYDLYLDRISG
ncbi:MAG TPA: hypothetical protein VFE42_30360 [Chloroflexota bacterium]|nr:hypothetical protein [Chloroflexota bacterium]